MSAEKRQWTQQELDVATERVCISGREAGIAFFGRHPQLGFSVAVELQCEHTALYEALQITYNLLQSLQPGCDCAACTMARATLSAAQKEGEKS